MSGASEAGSVRAVTLAREYGSEAARSRGGWRRASAGSCSTTRIVDRVAPVADLTPGEAATLDERGESFVTPPAARHGVRQHERQPLARARQPGPDL